MKILIVGDWTWYFYEQACADALESLGHDVYKFSWSEKFKKFIPDKTEPIRLSISARFQERFLMGPLIQQINEELIDFSDKIVPDIIFFYRATHIFPKTIKKLKKNIPQCILVNFCNDDPFSSSNKLKQWKRHLIKSIPNFDVNFVYRKNNIAEFNAHGSKKSFVLRSYFIPDINYPEKNGCIPDEFISDIVFAGHYEDDFRRDYLETLISAGFKVNLFGGGWANAKNTLSSSSPIRNYYPIQPAVGENYRKAISGAKIALCFLSKINRDTYTRRNFEIPATGTFMFSEYSEDLDSLFKEGIEAEYFRSKAEFIDKIEFYLHNNSAREKIAKAGYERVYQDGHDVKSRMKEMLQVINKLEY